MALLVIFLWFHIVMKPPTLLYRPIILLTLVWPLLCVLLLISFSFALNEFAV